MGQTALTSFGVLKFYPKQGSDSGTDQYPDKLLSINLNMTTGTREPKTPHSTDPSGKQKVGGSQRLHVGVLVFWPFRGPIY